VSDYLIGQTIAFVETRFAKFDGFENAISHPTISNFGLSKISRASK
jgi:hypothetical protein